MGVSTAHPLRVIGSSEQGAGQDGSSMMGSDDFDRAVLLAVALIVGLLLFACVGLALLGWLALRPDST
jgi:hypothetical protein